MFTGMNYPILAKTFSHENIGVVVENFSFVFQSSGTGAKSITREQMRSFKKIWGEFANPKTGYLERANFVPFFGVCPKAHVLPGHPDGLQKLSGVFEVRLYPIEHSIPNIMAACRSSSPDPELWPPPRISHGIDLGKLSQVLDRIDFSAARKRRAVYSRLYHEASITHQQGRGISFTGMLMLLAHHKLIVDKEALESVIL